MKEQQLHQAFIAYLQKQGYVWRRDRMDKRTSAATGSEPDFWVARNGRCCWIEFKCGKNKPSAAQQKRFAELHAAGCIVAVCYSLEDAVEHVETAFSQPLDPTATLFKNNLRKYVPVKHLDCVGTDQGKIGLEECVCAETSTRNCPVHGTEMRMENCYHDANNAVQHDTLYLVKSRTPGIGTVVVRYDTDGAAIYVRQANAHDIMTMPSAM